MSFCREAFNWQFIDALHNRVHPNLDQNDVLWICPTLNQKVFSTMSMATSQSATTQQGICWWVYHTDCSLLIHPQMFSLSSESQLAQPSNNGWSYKFLAATSVHSKYNSWESHAGTLRIIRLYYLAFQSQWLEIRTPSSNWTCFIRSQDCQKRESSDLQIIIHKPIK